MREVKREAIWIRAAERLVTLPSFPPQRAELVGSKLADSFNLIFPFDTKEERDKKLRIRAQARQWLREEIEDRLPIRLP